jgi:hypothetical protein
MARMADAHVEQIKMLLTEGKAVKEIVEIMDKTYPGVSFVPSQIYYVKKAMKVSGDPSVKVKKHYKKRAAATEEIGADRTIKDIIALLSEIQSGYKSVFAHLRKELIRSRAEVCMMLTGAGLPEIESDIE